jgi:hypothetical protein
MKTIILLALSAALFVTASAAPTLDKLLEAPTGFIRFVIHTEQWGGNEFYLRADKILAVRIPYSNDGKPASSTVEIYTMAPGSEYSPAGKGEFVAGNQRFLLELGSPEEARKAVESILAAIGKADRSNAK